MAPWVRGRGVQGKVLGLLAPALIVAAVCASCGGAVAFATAERDSPLRLASRPDSAGRVSAGGGAPPKVRDESEDDDGPIVLSSRPDSIGRVSTGGGTPNVHEDEDDDGPIVLSSRPDSVIRRRTDDVADDDNINDAHAEAPRGDDAPPQAPIDPIDADDSEDEEEDEEEEEPVRWEREVFDDVDVFEVVTFGDSETLGNLLAVGQDANARNGNGTTLLSVASAVGNLAAAELLLQAGAHVNATDLRSRNTSLHVAADRGFEEIARLLLSYGASPDIKNAEGETVRGTIQRAAQAAMAMATALPAAPSQGIPFGSLEEGGGRGRGTKTTAARKRRLPSTLPGMLPGWLRPHRMRWVLCLRRTIAGVRRRSRTPRAPGARSPPPPPPHSLGGDRTTTITWISRSRDGRPLPRVGGVRASRALARPSITTWSRSRWCGRSRTRCGGASSFVRAARGRSGFTSPPNTPSTTCRRSCRNPWYTT